MNRKPFNNKSNYDPGRFRTLIQFKTQQSTDDGSGGSNLTYSEGQSLGFQYTLPIVFGGVPAIPEYECKSIELQVRDEDQLVIEIGASSMNGDKWFVIRAHSGFTPKKYMNVYTADEKFILRAIVPVDNPVHYYRLLCVKQNG